MYKTLISSDQLAAHLGDPDWVVFDCRHDLAQPQSGAAAYAAGHIPGARFAHTDTDLSGAKTGHNGRHPLPGMQSFVDFLQRSGVSDASQVVAYDASGGMYASRLWWMLRWIGHEAVAVLDGGLPAWLAAHRPVDAQLPLPRPGQVSIRPSLARLVDVATVQQRLNDGSQVIVDARAPERYRGEVEPMDPVAGHIPGALNRVFQLNLGPNGRFKPAAALREEFQALLGETAPEAVVNQCGSGVTACHNLLAMEVAGFPGAGLYAGSWSEWCADPSRPIEVG